MNIIKIVVDELPESASRCFAAESHWNALEEFEVVECRFMERWAYMSFVDFFTQRCLGCPLELEVETKEPPSDTQTGAAVYLNENTKWEDGDYVLNPEINSEQSLYGDYPADGEIVIVETQREIILAQHREGNWYNMSGEIVTDKVKHWWNLPEEMRNEQNTCY